MRKTVDYYNMKIEEHKATIKRLIAEKRIANLRERIFRKKIQNEKRSQDRTIQAAIINAVAIILVPFISFFLSSHSKSLSISSQKSDSTFINAETKGNLSPSVVNSPNSTFNMNTYIIPSPHSEFNGIDANQPK
jgi:hypothetical protein